jgi:mono/diheme cytochrome c family protein
MPIKKLFLILFLFLAFSLTACMSLAEDITPPPGMQAPAPSLDTPAPRPTATPLGPVFPSGPPDPNQGAPIYAEKCAPCHGETGMGDGSEAVKLQYPAAAFSDPDLARAATPADWYRMITQGDLEKFMPPFSSLSNSQIWDVVAYLYTLSTPAQTLQEGESLYLEHCTECHGEDGRQGEVDFTDQAFMSELSAGEMAVTIANGAGDMPAFDTLSQEQTWALTNYLRSLTFAAGMETVPDEGEQAGSAEEPQPTASGETGSEAPAPNQGSGTITVNVVDTSGSQLPAVTVTLRGYDEMEEVYTQTLTLAEGNSVTFQDVPLPTDRMYFASFDYAMAVYGSDILTVESTSPAELSLEIPYYQPTSDPSILQVDRLHVFFSFATDEILEVFQLYIFSNPTEMVLTPKEGATTAVTFTIPPDASNLFVEDNMSMAYRKTDDGFGIVNVYPDENSYQTVFSYQVPYNNQKADLSIPIGMDAGAVIVMAPSDGVKVRSDELVDAGVRDIEGISYNMLTGSDLSAGSNLEISLSGLPKESTQFIIPEPESSNSLVIGLAGFGVALIAAGVFVWLRNRNRQDEWDLEEEGEEDAYLSDDTPEDLMDAIITLDDQHRAGSIPEEAYHVRRSELKERLRNLMEAED